jgi:hypothetical protein
MKKMLMILALPLMALASSCVKNTGQETDPYSDHPIVGQWISDATELEFDATEEYTIVIEGKNLDPEEITPFRTDVTVEFNSDLTGMMAFQNQEVSFVWSVDGKKLKLEISEGEESETIEFEILGIKGNSAEIYMDLLPTTRKEVLAELGGNGLIELNQNVFALGVISKLSRL